MGQFPDTPLMKQYQVIKKKHHNALLLFRVGDFYETFGSDAVTTSQILDIVLTKRGNGLASETELAGFPHHALDSYLPKLVRAGYRVAICDQLEDPKSVKGLVKRGVTELITPGVSFNNHVLEKKRNNFLASLYQGPHQWGISFLDISTGEFYCAQGSLSYVLKLIETLTPTEIIYSKEQHVIIEPTLKNEFATFTLDDWIYTTDYAVDKLLHQFRTTSLRGFGIENLSNAVIASGAILHYLEMTEHKHVGHLNPPVRIDEDKYMWLDKFTIRHLELIEAQHENGTSLLTTLDQTITPMGARLLRQWIVLPLKEKDRIEERLNIVSSFYDQDELAASVSDHLHQIADLERLISKVAVGRINPRELLQLKKSMLILLPLKEVLKKEGNETLKKIESQLDPCSFLIEKIEKELNDNPPLFLHQGGTIKNGVHPELDETRKISSSGKDYLLKIQQQEAKRTGIGSLKIAYNKVFGYYLEVSNTHKEKVPSSWIRKQTLVNAERFVTEELKVYEEKIIHAEEQQIVLEQQIFNRLVSQATDFISTIQQNARLLAQLDILLSFSLLAKKNQYVRPHITTEKILQIKGGRHPVIETQLPTGEDYVPNDIYVDDSTQQILIITGPNMAGKSALLRQTALIVLMAQMGSYVPADSVSFGLIDKIFTRVGASDNISGGESTFMVEMTETASILNNMNTQSLILMDEVGRGTSTYDGVSIAWAIVEYLHTHPKAKPKTLFATHYHELNQLEERFSRIKNFNVSVKEVGEKILFMRKLKAGGSSHSFGIHVAQMAGIPSPIVLRAHEILRSLEKQKKKDQKGTQELDTPSSLNLSKPNVHNEDPLWRSTKKILSEIDINSITPIESLLKLSEILALINEKKNRSS